MTISVNSTQMASGVHFAKLAISQVNDAEETLKEQVRIPVVLAIQSTDPPQVVGLRIAHASYQQTKRNVDKFIQGDRVNVWVDFDQPVVISGRPLIELAIGNAIRHAWLSDCGLSSSKRFSYTIGPEDYDEDGISISANALLLNRGTIRDRTGVDASVDLSNHLILNDPDHAVRGSQ